MSDLKKREFASGFGLTFKGNFLSFTISFKKSLRVVAVSDIHISILPKLRLKNVNAQLASREIPMGKNVEKSA
jgi:hypothetical protein